MNRFGISCSFLLVLISCKSDYPGLASKIEVKDLSGAVFYEESKNAGFTTVEGYFSSSCVISSDGEVLFEHTVGNSQSPSIIKNISAEDISQIKNLIVKIFNEELAVKKENYCIADGGQHTIEIINREYQKAYLKTEVHIDGSQGCYSQITSSGLAPTRK